MIRWRLILMVVSIVVSGLSQAANIAGVEVAQQVQLEGSAQTLQLNGAGVRKKFFVKVYVAGLYLPQTSGDAKAILAQSVANRVLMHFVYSEVSKAKMDAAWEDGFKGNLEASALQAMRPRLDQFKAMFRTLVEGDVVWLDYLPEQGTRVTINGQSQGLVPGADFNAALLAVWLGDQPVTSGLKKALLGADN